MARVVVTDSSVVLPACLAGGLHFRGEWEWWAPRLMCSEVLSALHEAFYRGDITRDEAKAARSVLATLPLRIEESARLSDEAWRIADELGFAKTYDAEFLALARLSGGLMVTADARLRRGAERLGFVVDPIELDRLADSSGR